MTYHLVGLTSDIVEDHAKHGEGKSTGCGYPNEKIGEDFATFESMLKYLSVYYGLSDKAADYNREGNVLETSRTVANHSEAQNGGWMNPTDEEYAQWHAGKIKLYSDNYTIRFHEY